MGILDSIVSSGVGSIIKGAADIVDRFVTTSDEKIKAMQALREIEQKEAAALLAATSAVISEEAKSEDPWVRRARPTFLYIIYIVIAFNFIFIPILGMGASIWGKTPFVPIALPEDLYWLFGSGYLGYAGARTWDKWKAKG